MLKYLNNLGVFGWMLTLLGFIVLITVSKWIAVLLLVVFIIVSIVKCWDKVAHVTRSVMGFMSKFKKETKENK